MLNAWGKGGKVQHIPNFRK